MLGCRWIGLQVRTSRRHTGPTACPGICRQHPSPRHQFSRECGSVKKYFQEVDRSRPSVLMLEFLDFQVNVCPGQAGRIEAIEVTERMTGKPDCDLKAVGNDCLTRRKSIRLCVPSHIAYEVGAARQQTVRSPRTMDPHSQEWHRNREATVYLPA